MGRRCLHALAAWESRGCSVATRLPRSSGRLGPRLQNGSPGRPGGREGLGSEWAGLVSRGGASRGRGGAGAAPGGRSVGGDRTEPREWFLGYKTCRGETGSGRMWPMHGPSILPLNWPAGVISQDCPRLLPSPGGWARSPGEPGCRPPALAQRACATRGSTGGCCLLVKSQISPLAQQLHLALAHHGHPPPPAHRGQAPQFYQAASGLKGPAPASLVPGQAEEPAGKVTACAANALLLPAKMHTPDKPAPPASRGMSPGTWPCPLPSALLGEGWKCQAQPCLRRAGKGAVFTPYPSCSSGGG